MSCLLHIILTTCGEGVVIGQGEGTVGPLGKAHGILDHCRQRLIINYIQELNHSHQIGQPSVT